MFFWTMFEAGFAIGLGWTTCQIILKTITKIILKFIN